MEAMILILFILTGSLTMLIGWLIRFRQKLKLLAGYDEEITIDKKGLAIWAGTNLMVMAAFQVLSGIVGIWVGTLIWASLAFAALTLIIMIILALGVTQYTKSSIQ